MWALDALQDSSVSATLPSTTITTNNNMVTCVTASSSTFHYCNNTTITNNNHNHNHNHINYHDNDDSHHNHHNNFIMTKKKAARTKTSPGEFYYFSLFSPFVLFDINKCFIVSTCCIYDIHEREWVGRPEMTKTGPNDMRCIV